MQKSVFYTLILLLLIAACKYEDGPVVSFQSKASRLDGAWDVEKVIIDGVDSTQFYHDSCHCRIAIYKDWGASHHQSVFYQNCREHFLNNPWGYYGGHWWFSNNKKSIVVDIGHKRDSLTSFYGIGPVAAELKTEWKILKLTRHDFNFETQVNGKKYIFELHK
jgi:hypothetical protein